MADQPRELADRLAVQDTVTRMAVLADRRDWQALTGIFADQVRVDYTALTGGEPGSIAGADLVAGWAGALGGYQATQQLSPIIWWRSTATPPSRPRPSRPPTTCPARMVGRCGRWLAPTGGAGPRPGSLEYQLRDHEGPVGGGNQQLTALAAQHTGPDPAARQEQPQR